MPPLMLDQDHAFGATDHRRVRVGLCALGAALVLSALIETLNALSAQRAPPIAAVGMALFAASISFGGVALMSRWGLPQTVLPVAMGLMVTTVPATAAQYSGPVVVLGPIVLVALALPYLSGRRLVALMALGAAVTPLNVAISEYRPGPPPHPGPLAPEAFFVLMATLFVAVVFLLLFQFSTRLRELRQEERASRLAAQQLTAQMRTMVQAAPTAIAVFDADAQAVLWNPATELLFEASEAHALGRPVAQLISGEPRLDEVLAGVRAGRTFTSIELQGGPPGKPRRPLELSAAPLLQGGVVSGFVLLAVDASTRKKLEADVLHAQKLESVGQLAGGIAHDFNNLLTIVTAEASLLSTEALPPPTREGVEAIEEAARRAAELCKQLLSFSRRQLVQPRPHDLSEVLAGIVPMLQRMVGSAVTLHFTRGLEPMVAVVDRSQFEQVVLNLVVNARDAMPQGGEVYLHLDALGGQVVFTVRDTGAGMPEEVQARAFEPFFTTKEHGRGTGLGLATVKDVVTRAGGTIELHSRLGEGTRFRICLPRTGPGVTEAPQAALRSVHAFRGLEVLLVDDDAAVRQVAEKILTTHGAVVRTAADAPGALALLEAHPGIRVLVTDVIMPGINGRVLAEQAAVLRPGLPVLFTSGYSTDAALAALVERGAAHFLPKPFTRLEFEQALQRTLEAGAPRPTAAPH